ncbi:MAG TPA: glycine--tRNA ligase subunit beta [Candidatus Eisenbacteria bacterium]|nr:glycine--tRNA ligase subunit beta [Candidatus Eisenbacteria bacterium]
MTRDLLFEIGAEELPGGYVAPALEQLERAARDGLAGLRLPFGDLCSYGTPRRLTLFVKDLAERQADFDEEAMGPAVKVAFAADGTPTRALLGFCQGKGVDPSQVRRVETPKGEYVAVTVHQVGKPALEVLPALLSALPGRLAFPKSMRWLPGDDARFARPVRWLTALFGDDVVPARAFAVTAGRVSYGHRFLAPGPVEIPSAGRYLETLERVFVMADHRARRLLITEQIEALAGQAKGTIVEDEELMEQNNFLVEWPTAFTGSFDHRFHVLPNEVIITALREHQKFFAIAAPADGGPRTALRDRFVAVRNGDDRGLDGVRRGNEDVLAARLDDARFYWETDLKHPPAERVEALKDVVWIEGLGSLRDKAARLESLCAWIAEQLASAAAKDARRAALLCKTDLLSEMIGSGKEYAALQGTIGGYYAEKAGEPEAVAQAIFSHYHPRYAGDTLPPTDAGVVLAIADKLDHVAGVFVAGKAPSGSEDPYGVRRAGNGVIRLLTESARHLDLREATMQSTAPFFAANPELPQAALMKQLGEFWRARVESALEQEGIAYDTREAALEAQVPLDGTGRSRPGWIDPVDCLERARVLSGFRGDRRFAPLVILFKRVGNILKASTDPLPEALDKKRLTEAAERELLASLERARDRTSPLWQKRAYGDILPALLEMDTAIHGFFDQVMVNVEDPPVRLNRLRLLAEVRELFLRGWDLSRVVVEGEKPA